jgi:hypothetical protein
MGAADGGSLVVRRARSAGTRTREVGMTGHGKVAVAFRSRNRRAGDCSDPTAVPGGLTAARRRWRGLPVLARDAALVPPWFRVAGACRPRAHADDPGPGASARGKEAKVANQRRGSGLAGGKRCGSSRGRGSCEPAQVIVIEAFRACAVELVEFPAQRHCDGRVCQQNPRAPPSLIPTVVDIAAGCEP